jgi:hypothetical protein
VSERRKGKKKKKKKNGCCSISRKRAESHPPIPNSISTDTIPQLRTGALSDPASHPGLHFLLKYAAVPAPSSLSGPLGSLRVSCAPGETVLVVRCSAAAGGSGSGSGRDGCSGGGSDSGGVVAVAVALAETVLGKAAREAARGRRCRWTAGHTMTSSPILLACL